MLSSTDKILREIAKEQGHNIKIIEVVVRKMHSFIAEAICEGSGKSVRLQKFGVFTLKDRVQKLVNKGKTLAEIKEHDQDIRYQGREDRPTPRGPVNPSV